MVTIKPCTDLSMSLQVVEVMNAIDEIACEFSPEKLRDVHTDLIAVCQKHDIPVPAVKKATRTPRKRKIA